MDIPLDEVIYFDAIASSSTGAAADADSTPTFEVFEESTDTDIGVGGNFTKRTSKTGDYRASFTCSLANGFEVGKWYNVIGSATIGGVVTKGRVFGPFRVSAVEAQAGYRPADVKAWNGVLLSTTNPLPNAAAGAANGLLIVGANTGTLSLGSVTITGTDASGATPAKAALSLIGGAASTTSGGTAWYGLDVRGGAGAASVNGAFPGGRFIGGGTNTVSSIASGVVFQGTSDGHGSRHLAAGTGSGLSASGSPYGISAVSIAANLSGSVGTVAQGPDVYMSGLNAATGFGPSTVEWPVGAFGSDNVAKGMSLRVITDSGSGAGQERTITGHDDSTGVMTLDRPWDVTPTAPASIDIVWGNNLRLNSTLDPELLDAPISDVLTQLNSGVVVSAISTSLRKALSGIHVAIMSALGSQTSFTLHAAARPASDGALTGWTALFYDPLDTNFINPGHALVSDYDGDTGVVTLDAAPNRTISANDAVYFVPPSKMHAAALSAGAANKMADHSRRRTQANVEASADGDALSAHSLYGLVQQAQESNTTAHAGKLTVLKTDGVTELAQLDVSSSPSADPITGVS